MGGTSKLGAAPAQEALERAVGGNQLPVAVDGEGWIGLVAPQHQFDGAPGRAQLRILQLAFRENRGEAGRDQQHVAIPQGNVEALGQMQNHVATGLGATGLHKAQVPG
jgi:hypothetical protein